MTPEPDFDHDQLKSILADLCDGQLSSQQMNELRALLSNSSDARDFYVQHAMMHAMLEWEHATPLSATHPDGQKRTSAPASGTSKASGLGASADRAAPAPSSDSKLFGFLGGFGNTIGSSPILFGAGSVLLLALIVAAVIAFTSRQIPEHHEVAAGNSVPAGVNVPASGAPSIARITATRNCRWDEGQAAFDVGDSLAIGQSLRLASGVAELKFDVGATVIVQSPATFSVESGKAIRMSAGKLTAEITKPEARGFKVLTPEATYVDQGTEFGVEVAPGGNSRVHVFQGAVDLSLTSRNGIELPSQRLRASFGARLDGDAPQVTFLHDTGDAFIRSLGQTDRDPHVIAYWRFEDQPLGTLLPDTDRNTKSVGATTDSTFNGNDLFVWSPESRPTFSSDVPAPNVPQTNSVNRGCLDLTDPFQINKTRSEVYTNSKFNHASPIDIQKITPAQWTIEASVKVKEVNHTGQVIVARDGLPGQSARFSLRVNDAGKFSIDFIDVDERHHVATSPDAVEANRWYHLAGWSDGKQLRLYVDRQDGQGYQLEAVADLPADGSTALGSCGDDCSWAVGRVRLKKGSVGGGLLGWIDEVRISDVALNPTEFLFAANTTKDEKARTDSEREATLVSSSATFGAAKE